MKWEQRQKNPRGDKNLNVLKVFITTFHLNTVQMLAKWKAWVRGRYVRTPGLRSTQAELESEPGMHILFLVHVALKWLSNEVYQTKPKACLRYGSSQLISRKSLCRECRSILNQYSAWHRGSSLLQYLAALVAKLLSATDFFWAPSHSHFNSWCLGSRGKGCWNLCLICCLNTSLWIDGLVHKRIDLPVRLKWRYATWFCLEGT